MHFLFSKVLIFTLTIMNSAYATNTYWNWNSRNVSSRYGNLPKPRNYQQKPEYHSACGNGQGGQKTYGFACPHMMMLSDDMLSASKRDNLTRWYYAVAGSASDDECGKCYQVQLLDAEREWVSNFKQLIIQVINSGHDVMRGQFDIFMGGGGFGYFTACNSDCKTKYCQGGACHASMYTSPFKNWNNAEYNDPNICYSGGIKWLDHKNNSELLKLCRGLVGNSRTLKDNVTVDSCFRTNRYLYHQNFVSLNAKRVACPEHLYKLTGLRRRDDQNYPKINITNKLDIQCRGDRTQGHYCITTMQDCCKPSCSWSNKGYPDTVYSRADTCDKNGNILDYY